MSHFCLIGGAGFLGSHLTDRLLADGGHKVTVVDLVPPTGASNLAPVMGKVTYRWKSALDLSVEDLEGADVVVHLASQADVPLALASPRYTFEQNVLAVVNTLEVIRARRSDARYIYLSSENVYGNIPYERLPVTEEETLRPANPYGASKAAADLTCQSYERAYGMNIKVLRLGTLFGPRGRLKQVIPIFIQQALEGKPITLEGKGEQSRDLNYVTNVVDGIVRASESPAKGVFNLASGRETKVRDLAETILKITGSSSKIEYKPYRAGEQGLRIALSIEKARAEFGYEPIVSLEKGLEETLRWLRTLHDRQAKG